MSVLAIVSIKNGAPTKSGLEAASYAANYAASQGMTAAALVAGEISGDGGMGATGIAKVLHCTEPMGQIDGSCGGSAQCFRHSGLS
jgi:hypothetical protein